MEAIFGDLDPEPGLGALMPMMLPRGTMASRHKHFGDADLSHLPVAEPEFDDALSR